jgi:ribosomal protein S18 acetylase RimI-like enzyme
MPIVKFLIGWIISEGIELVSVEIRTADLADLHRCLAIDTSFTTDHVWQMDGYETNDEVSATFRTVRLPRMMKVSYPRDMDSLLEDWRLGECFLLAENGDEVIGYLDMTIHRWNMTGWLNNIIVAKAYRRRGVGTALLKAAGRWAQQNGLHKMMAESQTKNYPAICFYQKHAYRFCGFNDQYYANQDIVLFFVLNL